MLSEGKAGDQVCDKSETGEGLCIPDSTVRSGDLVVRKAERKKIDALEMWCWWRMMSVVDGEKTNVWVPENIKSEWTLELRVTQAALRYVMTGTWNGE